MDEKKAYLDALFIEYQIIRSEIRLDTDQFYRLLQFGSTVIVAFIGVAFTFWDKEDLLVLVIFGGLLPTVAFIFIELLIGQLQRIRVAAQYCQLLEEKLRLVLNQRLQDFQGSNQAVVLPSGIAIDYSYPIGWETWMRGGSGSTDRHSMWIYRTGIAFFALVSWVSIALYEYYILNHSLLRSGINLRDIIALVWPIVLELSKTSVWLGRARQIAYPLQLPIPKLLAFLFFELRPSMAKFFTRVSQVIKRSADFSGLLAVSIQAILIFFAFDWQGLTLLLIVVITGSLATLYRAKLGKHEVSSHHEPRTWKNAVANAGVATLLAIVSLFITQDYIHSLIVAAFVASLVSALSDTLSHELGVTFGGKPRLITSLQPVPPGTDGAISLIGTLVGLVACVYLSGIALAFSLIGTDSVLLVVIAGFFGNVFDSVLGATVQKIGWFDNDIVNLFCTIVAALCVFIGSAI
jgi:uncharacterized protein (TIGR00297 family)